MFSKLLALACVLGAGAPALAQTCNGDGGYSCPAQDSVIPIQDGYNPADVNWNAVVADVLAMTDAEPRLCTMAIRAWFHDGAAHQGELRGQPVDDLFPGIGGSDGSIITHDVETEQEQNASHGFARIVRHVLVQLAAAHGTSHADALTIFAAMCPMRLQSQVDLPGHCTAQGFPLYVGRADYVRPDNLEAYPVHVSRTNQLSQPHTRIPNMYRAIIKDVNEQISDPRWHLTQRDATALMGAHGNMQTQNCMTDGTMPGDGVMPGMTDRTCMGEGGSQRMFKWGNHYWQDVRSGSCNQTSPDDGGAKMDPETDSDFTSCAWNSMEGFALSERMECAAFNDAARHIADKGVRTMEHEQRIGVFADGWREGKWRPGTEENGGQLPAPCCGYTCQTCEEAPGAFWCTENDADRYWPYGYFDCDWNIAYRMGSSYCTAGQDFSALCNDHWGGEQERIRSMMDTVKPLVDEYATSVSTWQHDYAVAFCKFAHFGANYTTMTPFTSVYTGATTGCLQPSEVLSPKQCADCQIAGRDPTDFTGGSTIPSVPVAQPVANTPADETATVPAEVPAEAPANPPAEVPAETPMEPETNTAGGSAGGETTTTGGDTTPEASTTGSLASKPKTETTGSTDTTTVEEADPVVKDEPAAAPKECGSLCAWLNYWSSLSSRRMF